MEITKRRLNGIKILNANSEIYGPCRHCSAFHRYRGTDERQDLERDRNDDVDPFRTEPKVGKTNAAVNRSNKTQRAPKAVRFVIDL